MERTGAVAQTVTLIEEGWLTLTAGEPVRDGTTAPAPPPGDPSEQIEGLEEVDLQACSFFLHMYTILTCPWAGW